MEMNQVLKFYYSETIKMENTHYLPHFSNHAVFLIITIHCKIKSTAAIFSLIYWIKLPSENLVYANVNTRMIDSTVNLHTMVTVILSLHCYIERESDMSARKII